MSTQFVTTARVKEPNASVSSNWGDLPCTVRIVRSESDYEKVLEVRRRGFAKFLGPGADVRDKYDLLPTSFIFLAEDQSGNPVGTGRLLRRPHGPVETAHYADLSTHSGISECMEGTKFTIPPFPGSAMTKLAIWKAGYLLALALNSPALMVAARRSARRDYEALLFEDTGITFIHPLDAQKRSHSVMWLDLREARNRYKTRQHPLYDFFFEQKHPQIRLLD